MIVKELDLSIDEVKVIQDLNTELVTLKNLIMAMDDSTSEFIYNKVMSSLKIAQFNYDAWFTSMQKKYSIITKPEYRWNVDFEDKKLQLLSN